MVRPRGKTPSSQKIETVPRMSIWLPNVAMRICGAAGKKRVSWTLVRPLMETGLGVSLLGARQPGSPSGPNVRPPPMSEMQRALSSCHRLFMPLGQLWAGMVSGSGNAGDSLGGVAARLLPMVFCMVAKLSGSNRLGLGTHRKKWRGPHDRSLKPHTSASTKCDASEYARRKKSCARKLRLSVVNSCGSTHSAFWRSGPGSPRR